MTDHSKHFEHFDRDGFAIVRGLAPEALRERMLDVARAHLAAAVPPLEYEADVQYPGAPPSHDAPGGRTVRRLHSAASIPAMVACSCCPGATTWNSEASSSMRRSF